MKRIRPMLFLLAWVLWRFTSWESEPYEIIQPAETKAACEREAEKRGRQLHEMYAREDSAYREVFGPDASKIPSGLISKEGRSRFFECWPAGADPRRRR